MPSESRTTLRPSSSISPSPSPVAWLRTDIRREGFSLLHLPEDQRASAIAWFAKRVMRLQGTHIARKGFRDEPHHWTFLHGALVEGARFSTAPGISEFTMCRGLTASMGGSRTVTSSSLASSIARQRMGKSYFPTRTIGSTASHWMPFLEDASRDKTAVHHCTWCSVEYEALSLFRKACGEM